MKIDQIKIFFILPSLKAGGAERVISFVSQNIDKDKFKPYLLVAGFEKDSVYDVSNIEVYNTSGQSVYNIADILNTSRSEYSIENLTSGLYIIRLSADDGFVVTKKVTVK